MGSKRHLIGWPRFLTYRLISQRLVTETPADSQWHCMDPEVLDGDIFRIAGTKGDVKVRKLYFGCCRHAIVSSSTLIIKLLQKSGLWHLNYLSLHCCSVFHHVMNRIIFYE